MLTIEQIEFVIAVHKHNLRTRLNRRLLDIRRYRAEMRQLSAWEVREKMRRFGREPADSDVKRAA
jgi:hypothetical protein